MSRTPSADLRAACRAAAAAVLAHEPPPGRVESIKEQFLILVTCRDEKHQVEVLG